MAGQLELFRQDDFTGGLNLRADQFQLGENESPSMLNVDVDPRGGVFSRAGFKNINSSVILSSNWKPKNLFSFYGTAPRILVSTGKFSSTNGTVLHSSGGNFTNLSIAVTNTEGADFAAWGKTVYIAKGVDSQFSSWDQTTVTTINASGTATTGAYTAWGASSDHIPQANLTVTHAGKLWVANTQEFTSTTGAMFPNRIRWSDENAPTRWTQTNYIDINDGGEGITALASYGGALLVFKETSVYAILGYNSDTFQVVEIAKKVGATNKNSVVVTEFGVFFFSYPEGLFFYNGTSVDDVFKQIRPIMQKRKVNPAAIDAISVAYINRRVYVSLPYSDDSVVAYPSVAFCLDITVGSGYWTMHQTADGYGFSGGCSFVQSDGVQRHLMVHPIISCVADVADETLEKDNFGGSDLNFASYYRTRWIDGGNYGVKKMFRRPEFVLKQEQTARTITVDVYHDFEELPGTAQRNFDLLIPASGTGMIWNTSLWGFANWGSANDGAFMKTGSNLGLAKCVQLELIGPEGASWGMNSFLIKYNSRKVKG